MKCLPGVKNKTILSVLKSATILSSEPTSRTVQNCKSLLLSKGIHPGQVYAATQSLLSLLLASGQEEEIAKNKKAKQLYLLVINNAIYVIWFLKQ